MTNLSGAILTVRKVNLSNQKNRQGIFDCARLFKIQASDAAMTPTVRGIRPISLLWFSMTLLAIGVAFYAFLNVAMPTMRPEFVSNIFALSPVAAHLHLGFGLIAMVIGPFQLNTRLRKRFTDIHRQLGIIYVCSVAVSAVAGFLLAIKSYGGLVTHIGFALMASFWFFTTAMAFYQIMRKDLAAHRKWMFRSYALTLAGVTLRVYLGLSFAAGIKFSEFYPVLSWISWVPNLLLVDWFFLREKQQARS
jgi:uncharacterized membrane protein